MHSQLQKYATDVTSLKDYLILFKMSMVMVNCYGLMSKPTFSKSEPKNVVCICFSIYDKAGILLCGTRKRIKLRLNYTRIIIRNI